SKRDWSSDVCSSDLSQLAYQWGDIRDVVAGVDLGGSLRSSFFLLRFSLRSLLLWLLLLRLFLRSFFLCWCFFLRLSLWLFLLFRSSWLRVAVADARDDCSDVDGVIFVSEDFYQGACDWGWDLGIDLVGVDLKQWFVYFDGVADGLQPLGDGAFGDGLTELWHLHISSVARSGIARRCWCRFFCSWLFLSWCFFLRLSLWLFLLFGSSWLRVAVADARDDCSDVDGVVFVSEDFYQGACDWGWDLGINLVGGDLQQWFVYFDGVADGLQPLGDGAFSDRLTELWHLHISSVARCSWCRLLRS